MCRRLWCEILHEKGREAFTRCDRIIRQIHHGLEGGRLLRVITGMENREEICRYIYADVCQKGSPTSKLCSLQRPPTLSPLSCAGVLHTESSATNDGTCRHHTPPLSQRSSLSSVNDGDASLLWESLGVLDPSALNDISREQENPTISTMCRATRLLDYVATYPNTCQ